MAKKVRKMTLEQFLAAPVPKGAKDITDWCNGGPFGNCHCLVFAETGVWIKELVPVFQRLDTMLVLKELPKEVR